MKICLSGLSEVCIRVSAKIFKILRFVLFSMELAPMAHFYLAKNPRTGSCVTSAVSTDFLLVAYFHHWFSHLHFVDLHRIISLKTNNIAITGGAEESTRGQK